MAGREKRPRVIVVGGGFAGLAVARGLRNTGTAVTLIDRCNYHLFQPMLYQVATAALSPADIAAPIRSIVRHVENCHVLLGHVTGIDLEASQLLVGEHRLDFDYLVLAAGATHSYFGHAEWAALAPGLKTLEDATEIRKRLLLAFEVAEYETDIESLRAALTFAVIGGGPTGVELAGAIKEIAVKTLADDFRNIDTTTTRVILIEGTDRLLPSFDPALSARARTSLQKMGIEVMVQSMVTHIDANGLKIGTRFIPARNIFWAAGVQANPLAQALGVPLDRAGRVQVERDLSVPGHPNVFVAGDMAAVIDPATNRLVPGVAPAALQMGRHIARVIKRESESGILSPGNREEFRYRDKGALATIGKSRAVAQVGGWRLSGFVAWLLWGLVHIFFLIGFRNRLIVTSKWFWNWLIGARDARLITGDTRNARVLREQEISRESLR